MKKIKRLTFFLGDTSIHVSISVTYFSHLVVVQNYYFAFISIVFPLAVTRDDDDDDLQYACDFRPQQ